MGVVLWAVFPEGGTFSGPVDVKASLGTYVVVESMCCCPATQITVLLCYNKIHQFMLHNLRQWHTHTFIGILTVFIGNTIDISEQ
jgi:hypothetical protein